MSQMHRIMVGTSVQLGAKEVRAYCLHDDVYLSAAKKRDMAQYVLKNIGHDDGYVIVAGDFNTYSRRAERYVEKEF